MHLALNMATEVENDQPTVLHNRVLGDWNYSVIQGLGRVDIDLA
jgi:hypothetical protein